MNNCIRQQSLNKVKSELKPVKIYEKPKHRPFRSVSEYFEILEKRTGVKFEHPSKSPRKLESSLLLRSSHHHHKDNVLLFKNNEGVEYTKADKLILWSKDVEIPGMNTHTEGFFGEIEGHNPHWKLYEQENLRKQQMQMDPSMQGYYMSYDEYDEIDKNLRMARNMFMLEKCNPINDVYNKLQNHNKVRERIILDKLKIKNKLKIRTNDKGAKEFVQDQKDYISPHASQPSTAKTNCIILNPVMKG